MEETLQESPVSSTMKHKLECGGKKVECKPDDSFLKPGSSSNSKASECGVPECIRPPRKIARTCKTVPSSPIWQMSPSHEMNCPDWFPNFGTVPSHSAAMLGGFSPGRATLSHLVAAKLKKEREVLLDEWIAALKKRRDVTVAENSSSSESDCNEKLDEIKQKLRDELAEEYDKRLLEAESRLKSELATLEEREKSLCNELHMKDSQLDDEKKRLKDTLELLESELQCSICSELFINAVTLGCSHSFCEFCINSWKNKAYSQNQCPICRGAIITEVRSIVLDQYINRIVERFDSDLVDIRNDIIQQRKELEEMQALKEKMEQEANGNGGGGGRESGSGSVNFDNVTSTTTAGLGGSGIGNSVGNGGRGGNVHSRISLNDGHNSRNSNDNSNLFVSSSSSRNSNAVPLVSSSTRDRANSNSRNNNLRVIGGSSGRYSGGAAGSSSGGGGGGGSSNSNGRGYNGASQGHVHNGHNYRTSSVAATTSNAATIHQSHRNNGSASRAYRSYRSGLNSSRHERNNGSSSSMLNGSNANNNGIISSFHDRIGLSSANQSSNNYTITTSSNVIGANSPSDNNEYVSGSRGRPYGWGHCYKCGRRGHWANRCPF